jgi:F-type H+-transporting ATPase subunit b
MPQFNPEWFASQLFWLVVTFVGLYLLMSRIALPRMAQIMEERQDKIEDDLAKAEKLKSEAEEVYQAYEQQLAEARQQAQKTLKETGEKLDQESRERHEAFTQELNQQIADAETRIDSAKQEALNNLQSVAGEVAQDASAKLLGQKVAKEKAEKAVEQAMKAQSEGGQA